MATNRVRAKYNFAKDVRHSNQQLIASAKAAKKQNEKAADNSFWGRLAGGGLGALAGLALAPLTGGASLAVTAGLTGAGSYFGSKKGEANVGGLAKEVKSGGFGIGQVNDINEELSDYAEGIEQDRMMNAASDAFSIYMAGGGGLTPGTIGKGTGAFAKDAVYKNIGGNVMSSPGYFDIVASAGSQLISGGVNSWASKKGLGTAYEEYLKR